MKNNMNHKLNQGFSLLELLLVLGVIAALAIAAFIVYPSVQASNQAQSEVSNLNTVRANILQSYNRGIFTGLDNDAINTARGVPPAWNGGVTTAGTALNDIWGGAITVVPVDGGGGTDNFVSITMDDVPTNACLKFVPALVTNFPIVQADSVDIFNANGIAGDGAALDLNIGTLPASCGDGGAELADVGVIFR